MTKKFSYRQGRIILMFIVYLVLPFINCAAEGKNQPAGQKEVNNDKTATAILKGLDWLAKHQGDNGSWKSGEPDEYNAGVSGLALLAFLEAGFTQQGKHENDYNEVIAKGLKFLLSQQNADGSIGPNNVMKQMYNHSVVTYALAKAYQLTKDEKLKKPVTDAVKYLIDAQNPGKAWRYKARGGDSDMSVTSWCVKALKTAEEGGLIKVPQNVWGGVRSHLDDVTDVDFGAVGYIERGSVAIMRSEMEHFDIGEMYLAPSLNAIGVMCRIYSGQEKTNAVITNGANLLITEDNLPKWDPDKYGKIDYYYWYYGTQALLVYAGRDSKEFKAWKSILEPILISNQKKGGWKPLDRWCGDGGETYAVAINILTLLSCFGKPLTDIKLLETPEIKITPELEKKIKDFVIQLDNDDWQKRESAQSELIKIGEIVIPLIKDALKNNASAEVRMRAKFILEEIE